MHGEGRGGTPDFPRTPVAGNCEAMAWISFLRDHPIHQIAAVLEQFFDGLKLTSGVHFGDYDGTDIIHYGLCSQEDSGLGTLDIYLYYVGCRISVSNEVVKRYRRNSPGRAGRQRGPLTVRSDSTLGARCAALEINGWCGCGPDCGLDYPDSVRQPVSQYVGSQPLGVCGVGLKGDSMTSDSRER